MSETTNGPRAIIIMACDLSCLGAKLGWETAARCEEGLLEYQAFPGSTIILTAGMSNGRKFPLQKQTLAVMMKSYFLNRGVPEKDIVVSTEHSVWGSNKELSKALFLIFQDRYKLGSKDGTSLHLRVTVVSSDYHLYRLRYIVKRVLKRLADMEIEWLEWHFRYRKVRGDWGNLLQEGYKLPAFVLKDLLFGN